MGWDAAEERCHGCKCSGDCDRSSGGVLMLRGHGVGHVNSNGSWGSSNAAD